MEQDQLALFNTKKYQGVLPQTVNLKPPTGEDTVLKTIPAYYAYLRTGGYSKYTPDDFTGHVRRFGQFVKDKEIRAIRPVDIQQWIVELRRLVQEKTVSRKISAITNYFNWLMREQALQVSAAWGPLRRGPLPRSRPTAALRKRRRIDHWAAGDVDHRRVDWSCPAEYTPGRNA